MKFTPEALELLTSLFGAGFCFLLARSGERWYREEEKGSWKSILVWTGAGLFYVAALASFLCAWKVVFIDALFGIR